MKSVDEQKEKLVLLMMRCEYVEFDDIRLTAKGRAYLPCWLWRRFNAVLCYFSDRHKREVFRFLTDVKAGKFQSRL